jgi:mono/diheme cytochrome c family protein
MKRFILGLIVGVLLLPVGFILYVLTGHAPAATSDPPMPYESFIAGTALFYRIHKEAPTRDVSGMPTADLVAGAQAYQKNCAMCHGLPNQPAPAIANAIFPPAPQLFSPKGMVTDDPAGETYWKVKNGIRLTAMPSFKEMLSDDQMWQVAAVVARADKLPAEAQDALKPVPPTPAAEPVPAPPTGASVITGAPK